MPVLPRCLPVLLAIGLAGAAPVPAHGQPLPDPVASYVLRAHLEANGRRIAGEARIEWRNSTLSPTSELQFEMPWNAWRHERTTWARERREAGAPDVAVAGPGASEFTAVIALTPTGQVDLLARTRAMAPDDGNAEDSTVWSVPLDEAVRPGQRVVIVVRWTADVPSLVDRAGHARTLVLVADWFPRVGLFGPEGWTTHQTHARTRNAGPLSRFDVELHVPTGWAVGASGRALSSTTISGGLTAHRYITEVARDFAWATGPTLVKRTDRFTAPDLQPVDLEVLLLPEHVGQADRQLAAAKAALTWYGRAFGPYPWPTLTLVSVPLSPSRVAVAPSSSAGLIAVPTRWLSPWSGTEPEASIVAALGDLYARAWPGPDEVRNPWLGGPLAAYISGRAFGETFGGRAARVERYLGDVIMWPYADVRWHRLIDGPPRGAQALFALERLLGWETTRRIVAQHVSRRSPEPAASTDFVGAATSVSGRDVSWLFESLSDSAATFDYAVAAVTSDPASAGAADSTVTIRRHGVGIFPVEVLITFEDGSSLVERWDGRDTERRFRYEQRARVARVEIDPDHVLVLDTNRINNSWTIQPRAATAATRWTVRWALWAQHLLLTYACFV